MEEAEAGPVAAWVKRIKGCGAEIVIIDAPGAMGAAFGATIAVSDLVLIPSGATVLDIRGAGETVRLVRQHRKSSGRKTPDILILPSKIDKRTIAGKEIFATLAAITEPVGTAVSYRALSPTALQRGIPFLPIALRVSNSNLSQMPFLFAWERHNEPPPEPFRDDGAQSRRRC